MRVRTYSSWYKAGIEVILAISIPMLVYFQLLKLNVVIRKHIWKLYNYKIGMNLKDLTVFKFVIKPNNISRWVDDKDLGISIKKPGEEKVWDNRVIKVMKGVGDQGLQGWWWFPWRWGRQYCI